MFRWRGRAESRMCFQEIRRESKKAEIPKPDRAIPVAMVHCGFGWVFFESWATATHRVIGEALGDGIHRAG
jgi:hypothetical protein